MDNNKKNYIIYSSILLTIYLSGFFLYQFYYADDLYRSINGIFAWDRNGRLLTNFIFKMIAINSSVNIYPLGLIVGVFSVILCANRLRLLLFKEHVASGIIALVLCLGSPFLLQVYSYRYDSLTMTLAIALAIYTALLPQKNNFTLSVGIRTILLLGIWTLYQPAISLFLVLSFILFVENYIFQKKGANDKYFIYEYILSIVLSVMLYMLSVKSFISGVYSVEHSALIALSINGLHEFLKNVMSFTGLIKLTFSGQFKYLYYIYFILFLVLPFLHLICKKQYVKFSRRCLLLISPILVLFLSFCILCFLSSPVVQFRTMIGFSGLLIYGYYLLFKMLGFKWSNIVIIPLIIIFFVNANVYPKAQSIRYDSYLTMMTSVSSKIADLNDLGKTISISGDLPTIQENRAVINAFPIVKFSLKNYFSCRNLDENYKGSSGYFLTKHNFILDSYDVRFISDKYYPVNKLTPVYHTPYYQMYLTEDRDIYLAMKHKQKDSECVNFKKKSKGNS
ncbi:glucosyltransferase domain-containing protein [Celerinatantimonas sp. MCCC 1A17872]|uniref:glucosyltransferase domain-containing protein n=1 Tax=Celerinatantimonas sp. MCCC 1A17872 TaxID=3177514 RepID=UPI0038C134B4